MRRQVFIGQWRKVEISYLEKEHFEESTFNSSLTCSTKTSENSLGQK